MMRTTSSMNYYRDWRTTSDCGYIYSSHSQYRTSISAYDRTNNNSYNTCCDDEYFRRTIYNPCICPSITCDDEEPPPTQFLTKKAIRCFAVKVLALVAAKYALSTLTIALCLFISPIHNFLYNDGGLYMACICLPPSLALAILIPYIAAARGGKICRLIMCISIYITRVLLCAVGWAGFASYFNLISVFISHATIFLVCLILLCVFGCISKFRTVLVVVLFALLSGLVAAIIFGLVYGLVRFLPYSPTKFDYFLKYTGRLKIQYTVGSYGTHWIGYHLLGWILWDLSFGLLTVIHPMVVVVLLWYIMRTYGRVNWMHAASPMFLTEKDWLFVAARL